MLILFVGNAVAIPNPASVYCLEIGGTTKINDTIPGQQGLCVMPDGTKYDAWKFFECIVRQNYSWCAENGDKTLNKSIKPTKSKDETASATHHNLLKKYEVGDKQFKELETADKKIYYYQRMIDGAIVEKDQIVYQFDKNSEKLIAKKTRWRNDLPEHLPKTIITKEQAESTVEGDVQSTKLYIISPESEIFPIKPTPQNPCWVVRSIDNGNMVVTIIDAVEGKILGYGIPPPYNAFSLTGPTSSGPCNGGWDSWYQNARDWFNTMGYSTEAIKWPTEAKIQSHIQSNETTMFYEAAHGTSTWFESGCVGGTSYERTSATEIETWIINYPKKHFAFIGSCDGMCSTDDDTLSYEFRKGSTEDTGTVGYCGMSTEACATCWAQSVSWQDTLFCYMTSNYTIKYAFDQANSWYPSCAINNCMRFAGDEDFKVSKLNLTDSCNCSSCEECRLKFFNPSCPVVNLVLDINSNDTCITVPTCVTNKTFNGNGHTITGNGGGGTSGIYLSGITDFTVKNCKINNFSYGVSLYSSSNINLINNSMSSNSIRGIYLSSSSNNNITNNRASSNTENGIYLYSSSNNNSIVNNTVNSNNNNGISLESSSNNNSIVNNTVNLNNNYGIYLSYSNYNNITNNTVNNNNYGIYLNSGNNSNIKSNILNNTQTDYYDLKILSGVDNTIVSNNYFYGNGVLDFGINTEFCINENYFAPEANKPIGAYCNASCTDDDNDGTYQYDAVNCPVGNDCDDNNASLLGVKDNLYLNWNVTLCPGTYNIPDGGDGVIIFNASNIVLNCNGHTIDGIGSGYGIYMSNKVNNTIKNCNVMNYDNGIYLKNSSNNTIMGNNVSSNTWGGIRLYSSSNNTLVNNTANSNTQNGIYLGWSSNYNNLINNTANNNNWSGLYISSFSDISNTINSIGNTINSNAFCSNNRSTGTYYDIYDADSNSGDNNTCDMTFNWNDTGAIGCTYACSGCSFSITLNSPANETATTNTAPDFNFTVQSDANAYFCELFINSTGYGTNSFVQNNTAAVITANDTIADGTYNWYINCSYDGITNQSEIRDITIDTTPPSINFAYPTPQNNSNLSQTYILANITASDSGVGLDTITIYLYNSTTLINSTNCSPSPCFINFTDLEDGDYYINATANDTAGNENSTETRKITLETTLPSINFTDPTPQNNTILSQTYILANVTASDSGVGLDTITTYRYNSTTLINSTNCTSSPCFFNFTGLVDGTYYLNATANDTAGNENQTETRIIHISSDCYCTSCEDCEFIIENNVCSTIYLNASITNHSGTCINNPENFNNKIFDCQGYTIDGDDSEYDRGIYLNGKIGNTIRSCIVTDFYSGVRLWKGDGNSIINNTCNSNTHSGINFGGNSTNNVIANNTLNSNIYGAFITASSLNNITNNTANSNTYGLFTQLKSINIFISNNTCNSNTGYGISASASNYTTINNNNANLNTIRGISLFKSNYSLIDDNNITNNNGSGIYLSELSYANVTNNTVNSGNYTGIHLVLCTYNLVNNNTVNLNNDSGIFLRTSSNNTIENNTADSNKNKGIEIYSDSHYNNITNNTASNNFDDGISIRYSDYMIVSNNTALYNYNHTGTFGKGGIKCFNCSNTIIEYNNCSYNDNGIYLDQDWSNITVRYNYAYDSNDSGIKCWGSYDTNLFMNSIIHNNTLIFNGIGISIGSNSNNITAENNTINNTAIYYGITVGNSTNVTLTNNNIINSNQSGVHIQSNSINVTLNSNIVCNNNQALGSFYDVNDLSFIGTGDNNTCDTTNQWNDTGQQGCTNNCPIKSPSSCNLTFTPSSPQNYGNHVTASCTCTNPEAPAKLYRNGINVTLSENGTPVLLPAGNHSYVCNVSEIENYTSTSDSFSYQINKANSSCDLTFSPLSPQTYGSEVIATCTCTNPEASAELYRNGINVTSSENDTGVVLAVGIHNYVCNVSETENCSAALDSFDYVISKATPILTLTINTTIWTVIYETATSVLCVANTDQITPQLYKDGNSVNNPHNQTLPIGIYNYTCNASGTQNYTGGTESEILNVAPLPCSDGTPYGQCSEDKPKYCDNGILIDNCSHCGCPSEMLCNSSDGFCYYHPCDLNQDGIITNDWNDLMNAYKCFLGIRKICDKIRYQDCNLIKQEYQCFIKNDI